MFEGLADQAASAEGGNIVQNDSQTTAQQPTQTPPETQIEAQAPKEQQLIDLAKTGKFMVDGKEMTWDELNKERLRHADYTKKTQALAEERKFHDNLYADLNHVKRNPKLVAEFKKMYPERFHSYLDYVIEKQAANETPKVELPDEVKQKLERIDQIDSLEQRLKSFEEERLQAESAKINNTLEQFEQKFTKKYPQAELGSVYHAMETHVKKMRQENPEYGFKDMNEKVIESFYKSTHDYFAGRFTEWQKSQLKSIRETNKVAGDIPPGGGVPGGAPQKMKLKDVADHIIGGSDFQ